MTFVAACGTSLAFWSSFQLESGGDVDYVNPFPNCTQLVCDVRCDDRGDVVVAAGRLNGLGLLDRLDLQQLPTPPSDVCSYLAIRGGHPQLVLQADSLGQLHRWQCAQQAGKVHLSHVSTLAVSHRPLHCVTAWDDWAFFATSRSIGIRHLGDEQTTEIRALLPGVQCSTLSVDPQSLTLLGGTRNGSIARWSVTSLDLPGEVSDEAHLGPVRGVAAAEDCQYSAAMDGLICCWDFERMGGTVVGQSLEKQPGLTCLCSNGTLLGAGSKEGTLLTYDIRQLSRPASSVTLSSCAPVRAICWRPSSGAPPRSPQRPTLQEAPTTSATTATPRPARHHLDSAETPSLATPIQPPTEVPPGAHAAADAQGTPAARPAGTAGEAPQTGARLAAADTPGSGTGSVAATSPEGISVLQQLLGYSSD